MQDMLAAARLTRAGRVQEATALLQRALRGAGGTGAAAAPVHDDGDVIDVPFKEVDGTAAPERAAQGAAQAAGAATAGRASGPQAERAPHTASARAAQAAHTAQPAGSPMESVLQRFRMPQGPGTNPLNPARQHDPVDHGPGRFLSGEYANAAGTRSYRLYIPTSYTGEPMPLIVMLHGCNQSPEDFAAGTRMNLIAEKKGCLVLYPGQSSQANTSGCWNWFKREDQARGRGEPSLLAGMTRDVMAHWAVDGQRVYAAGLSAGGAMAAVLAVTYPELFAAVGIHSGLACGAAQDLPSALAAMRGMPPMPMAGVGATAATNGSTAASTVPTIVFHGDRDRTVHPSNGEDVLRAAHGTTTSDGTASTDRGQAPGGHAYTRTVHRNAAGTAVLEHWLVHGGGHAWFGGSTAGSYCDPRGPDASEEITRFFLAHGR
jgi:poly(hydroxyalkanoate) depolymerase family esterase